jgi:cytochrome c
MIRFRVATACAIALGFSLLLARVHPFGDAGLYSARGTHAPVMQKSNVPPQVRDLLAAKCADCHSSQTRTPFYGRLAPVSWLLERDILEGRKHMDLSAWDSYTPEEQQTLKAKIIQQTRSGKMPLPQYRNIHRGSAVTATDLAILSQWNHQPSLLETASAQQPPSGDVAEGKLIFEKRCTGCHALDQNREGPKLGGVFGRSAGQVRGFMYSPALENTHIVWNEMTLDRWLADPDAYVPGNNMDFRVVNPRERQELIRYFKEMAAK